MRYAFLVLFLLALSGCASMKQRFQQTYCSYNGGYALGVNHARADRDMDPNPALLCDEAIRSIMLDGYRKGYTEERRSRPALINIP